MVYKMIIWNVKPPFERKTAENMFNVLHKYLLVTYIIIIQNILAVDQIVLGIERFYDNKIVAIVNIFLLIFYLPTMPLNIRFG